MSRAKEYVPCACPMDNREADQLSSNSTPPPTGDACAPPEPALAGGAEEAGPRESRNTADEDDEETCSVASDDTDIDDVTEADFIFGPKIPDAASDCALTRDDIAAQVAIAARHLRRLDFMGATPQMRALFVRWTIHNWATQGPFNVEAYQDDAEWTKLELNPPRAEDGMATAPVADYGSLCDTLTHAAGEADDDASQPVRGQDEASDLDDEATMQCRVGPVDSVQARRMRGKGRAGRPSVGIDDIPLGQIAGAGSVIVGTNCAGHCEGPLLHDIDALRSHSSADEGSELAGPNSGAGVIDEARGSGKQAEQESPVCVESGLSYAHQPNSQAISFLA